MSFTIEVIETTSEGSLTRYRQTVEWLDLAGVIGAVNNLQKSLITTSQTELDPCRCYASPYNTERDGEA